MATTISAGNATNGLAFSADNTGALEFKTGSGAGTTALTLSTSQIATFAGNVISPLGTLYPLVSGTAVASTSGTSIDFTSIPSWVKRITVMFNGFSTSGTSNIQVQIGAGSVTSTGYQSVCLNLSNGSSPSSSSATTGFIVSNNVVAADTYIGHCILTNVSGNIWVESGTMSRYSTATTQVGSGNVTLSGTLDRVRITTVNGTDTFDAGSINILWE
jgi:hypothetical protein